MKKIYFFLFLGLTAAFSQSWFGGKTAVSSLHPTTNFFIAVLGNSTGAPVRLVAPQDAFVTVQPASTALTNIAATLQGFVVRQATSNTYVGRQIVSGNAAVSITDGAGASGNPTISLDTPLINLDTSVLNSGGTSNWVAVGNGRGGLYSDSQFTWDPIATQTADLEGTFLTQTIQAWNVNPRIDNAALGQSSKYWPKIWGSNVVQQKINVPIKSASGTVIDWNYSRQEFTLSGNVTFTFANNVAGDQIEVAFKQDATGGRVPTFPAGVYALPSTNQATALGIATAPNAITVVRFFYIGASIFYTLSGPDNMNLTEVANMDPVANNNKVLGFSGGKLAAVTASGGAVANFSLITNVSPVNSTNYICDASVANVFRIQPSATFAIRMTNGTDGQFVALQVLEPSGGFVTGVLLDNSGGASTNRISFGRSANAFAVSTNGFSWDFHRLFFNGPLGVAGIGNTTNCWNYLGISDRYQ